MKTCGVYPASYPFKGCDCSPVVTAVHASHDDISEAGGAQDVCWICRGGRFDQTLFNRSDVVDTTTDRAISVTANLGAQKRRSWVKWSAEVTNTIFNDQGVTAHTHQGVPSIIGSYLVQRATPDWLESLKTLSFNAATVVDNPGKGKCLLYAILGTNGPAVVEAFLAILSRHMTEAGSSVYGPELGKYPHCLRPRFHSCLFINLAVP